MKNYLFLYFFLIPIFLSAQAERHPVFKNCENQSIDKIESCFYKTTKELFFKEFNSPVILENEKFKGTVNVVFVVTNTGTFKVIYINSLYAELQEEVKRVFKTLPVISPAKYNNNNVEMRFALPLNFPLQIDNDITEEIIEEVVEVKPKEVKNIPLDERKKAPFIEHKSQLNIPFTHQRYINYDYALNKNSNAHTAVKPYVYNNVNAVYDLDAEKSQFLKPEETTWLKRKLWNEHLLEVRGDGYWFNVDFLLDVQLGKDNSDVSYTFNNSRNLTVNGGLGNDFSFSATIYESQGRFAGYINDFISNPSNTFKPAFSEGLVPGRGKAKGFKADAFDYPVAEGYLAYTPNKFLQFQFGNGKNFIGDGYRSLLLSDVSSPMPYLKMSVNFWKLNYTNIWLWGTDVRHPVVVNNEHPRKYIAIHYLSLNLTDKLNIGFFETAVSKGDQGFDIGFMNPLMFYRAVEFSRGEDAGNAMLGLTAKYKLKENLVLYSQLVVDEFSFGKISDLGYWGNKFGFQFGAKYFDAFNVKDLYVQAELNTVRPYTFAHKDPLLNYGNYSQPLSHAWGANFWEAILIGNYKFDRWTTSAKVIIGQKGFDEFASVSNGGDIYKSYDLRKGNYDNEVGQGNKAAIFIADFQGRYLLNTSNNLSLFGGFTFRNFSLERNPSNTQSVALWFSVGIKADLFNWYFDF
ncbi:gliding motility protein RemB [Polaribacter gochangensis]|uniref:gliding motility protein RemB n=1 Tax=Polaribacter gochangensis TaxID=3252903 RepID=UPI00390469BE